MCDQCPPLLHVWMTTVVVPTRPSGIIGMALVAEPSPLLSPKSTRTCEFDCGVFVAEFEYVEFDVLEI